MNKLKTFEFQPHDFSKDGSSENYSLKLSEDCTNHIFIALCRWLRNRRNQLNLESGFV